ncbi:UvrD-helicase domain-containing protein [Enterobacter hormaechei]|uniref:UvrD-helicase domain-containing protein n=1 Tax=Enterobacter hormaechei TaxID=158836 RepID=UPI0039BEDF79
MNNKIVIACAGAGKTHRIVNEAIESGEKTLIITYTISNQQEIYEKYKQLGGKDFVNFKVKGLFTFILEDIIRPYQNIVFEKRIESLIFNETDPHRGNNRAIPGRKEKLENGDINPLHYLTSDGNKIHSTYIAKLGAYIIKKTKGAPIKRLEEIYKNMYFDEVQDLVGWDYEIIKSISKSKKLSLCCVGDFRQTIYQTAITTKKPITTSEKITFFKDNKFSEEKISKSRRCILDICNFSDIVHDGMGFESTTSAVEITDLEILKHTGVFVIKDSDVNKYLDEFKPAIIRLNSESGKKYNIDNLLKVTYGKSKGLGYDRTLIIPTKNYIDFICGNKNIFDNQKTESSKNKLYVAITRARYSVAIVLPDIIPETCELTIWNP